MPPTHDRRASGDRDPWRPSIGLMLLIAAPMSWLLHLLVSYALVPLSCRAESDLPLHAVTAVAGLLAVGAAATAIRLVREGPGSWRSFVDEGTPSDEPDDRRTVHLLAACLAAYFAFVVGMTALVVTFVDRCA